MWTKTEPSSSTCAPTAGRDSRVACPPQGRGDRLARVSVLGNRVLRTEDARFLRGEGTYVENLPLEGAAAVTFVRSPFAHARITGVDASAATALPGIQVFTAADVDAP